MASFAPYTRHATCYEIEALLRAVRHRPAIWNKNYDGYNDRGLKLRMWEEVCESLIHNWRRLGALQKHAISCDIQKKWRNVKDAFKKELHIEKRMAAGKIVRKKKRYIYYEALSFLAESEQTQTPGVLSMEGSEEESDSTSVNQEALNSSTCKRTRNDSAEDSDSLLQIKHESTSYADELNSESNEQNGEQIDSLLEIDNETTNFPEGKAKFTSRKYQNKQSHPEAHFVEMPYESWDSEENNQESRRHQDHSRMRTRHERVHDEDISFAEMIVPMLRKLNDDQKHYARIEILNVLHKSKRYYLAYSSETQTDQTPSEADRVT